MRVVPDRLLFFNQPEGMLKNLSAAVESLWEAYACAFSATCSRTRDGRGLLASRVGELILAMDGSNQSRGSATLSS